MSPIAQFAEGDQVYSRRDQRQGRVIHRKLIGGEWHYRVDLGQSTPAVISARDLEPVRSLLDRLADGDCCHPFDFDLMTMATRLSFTYHYEGLSCLSNSRLEPKPYQIFVAHRVLQDLYPRYILADEVGLGKTIEAGLVPIPFK